MNRLVKMILHVQVKVGIDFQSICIDVEVHLILHLLGHHIQISVDHHILVGQGLIIQRLK